MVVLLLMFVGVFAVLCLIPALLLTIRANKEKTAKRTWMRVTGTMVRVETAQQYHSNSNGPGYYSTYLRGRYEYLDPRGGVHHGQARVKGVNLTGEPEGIPLLVNPNNWDESMVFPDERGRGCVLAVLWGLPVVALAVGLIMIIVAAMAGMYR